MATTTRKPSWVTKQVAAAPTPPPAEPPPPLGDKSAPVNYATNPPADFIDRHFGCFSDWKYRQEIRDGQIFHVFARKDFIDDTNSQTLDEWFNALPTFYP